MTKLTEEVIKNRRRIDDIYSNTDTAVASENVERLDYFGNKFTIETETTITQDTNELEQTSTQRITNEGAIKLIEMITGTDSTQINETQLGTEIVSNRRNQTQIDNLSSLNDNWTEHTVTRNGDQLIITSEMEVTEDEVSEIDSVNTLGILTNDNTLIQYITIDINSENIQF